MQDESCGLKNTLGLENCHPVTRKSFVWVLSLTVSNKEDCGISNGYYWGKEPKKVKPFSIWSKWTNFFYFFLCPLLYYYRRTSPKSQRKIQNVISIQFCFLTFEHILLNVQFCCVSLKLGLDFVAKIVEGTKNVPFHVLQPWLVTT